MARCVVCFISLPSFFSPWRRARSPFLLILHTNTYLNCHHLPRPQNNQADLDLGNYERFLDITLTRDHNLTTGKVYSQVIQAERRGDYLGKTVQVIPHVTDAIQSWLDRVSHQAVDKSNDGTAPDVCLVEVGGTVGDIESLVFLEALRQLQFRVRSDTPLCQT